MNTTRRDLLKFGALATAAAALPSIASSGTTPAPVGKAARPLNILILGGTGFTGPFQVNYALARGHKLTLFNRGKRPSPEWPGEVEQLHGDRNTGDYKSLAGRKWDVVIDNPTSLPFWVRDAAKVLKGNVGHYMFISTISVYADGSKPGMTEDAPLAVYKGKDAMAETQQTLMADIENLYGPLKALSEAEVRKHFGERSTIVRPGYIVGPRDETDRFTYWPLRVAQGGEMLVPGDGQDPIQIIDGRDLWAEPEKIREFRFLTGLVFQYPEYQLFEETCYKDIAFGPRNMGLDEAEIDRRVHEAADFVGLDEALLQRSPFELSGGQKRRVAVAGVMAMKPRILVLDEPAAGLDPEGRDEILSEVKEYHKKTGTTVLLVSHSMEDIAKYADRVLVMSNKKIAMYDTVENVFARAPELLALGLSVPQVTKIFLKLREMGVDVPADVYTVPYAVKMILEAKKRRDAGESLVLPRVDAKKGGAATC